MVTYRVIRKLLEPGEIIMVVNAQELVELSSAELSKRTKMALDEFVEALKTGEHLSQKGRVYQAYEAERMKRQKQAHQKYMWYAE